MSATRTRPTIGRSYLAEVGGTTIGARRRTGRSKERHLSLVSHLLDSIAASRSDGLCLEISCREREITSNLVRRYGEVIAVDSSARFARLAGKEADCKAQVADERKLPFPDAIFSTVACFHLAEDGPSWKAVLEEAVRVLKPGGTLVLTSPRTIPLPEILLRASAYLALGYRGLSSTKRYVVSQTRRRSNTRSEMGPTERGILDLLKERPIESVQLHLPRRRIILSLWQCGMVIKKRGDGRDTSRPSIEVCRRCS